VINKVLISFILLQLISAAVTAQSAQKIEIFDISKGKVIAGAPTSKETQQEVEKFLEGISGVYVKYNPIPNKGFMIRVPLEPHKMVKNQWFEDLVDEVTIIFSGQEEPYLMVFSDENRPYFLTFEGDTSELLELIDFKP